MPLVFTQETENVCLIADQDRLALKCPSFLRIYIREATFGRLRENGKDLCSGVKRDSRAPSKDCQVEVSEQKIYIDNSFIRNLPFVYCFLSD